MDEMLNYVMHNMMYDVMYDMMFINKGAIVQSSYRRKAYRSMPEEALGTEYSREEVVA